MNALHIFSYCTLFISILSLLCFDVNCLTAYTTGIPNCPIVDCGDGMNITYPFWVSNSSIDYSTDGFCGYIDFKITCNGTRPTMTTNSDNYTVTAVSRDTHTLSLTDTDVMNEECPRARHNVSFNSTTPLSIPHDVKYLWFFFNCTSYPDSPIPEKYHVICLQNVSGDSYVFDGPPPDEYMNTLHECKEKTVSSPVLPTTVDDWSLPATFGQAMKGGFELTWKDPIMGDCNSCEKSGGLCGYYNGSGSGLIFQCFCEDGVKRSAVPCNGTRIHIMENNSKLSVGKKIAIGFGGMIFGLLLAALGFFLYRRHKKQTGRLSSLTALFRNASSDPSALSNDPESLSGSYYKTPIFSYEELQEATGNFDEANELGDGGFGVVFKGKLKDGRIIAAKRLYERNYRRIKQFQNEVEILNYLRHRNLVTLYGCTSSRKSQDLILVYEYISNGTVADHLHGPRASEHALTWCIRMNIAIETADALSYLHLHQPQIIHRDVKTSNILLDDNYTVKVADFGLSRLFPLDVTHISTAPQGTPGYVDPEYHQTYQLTDKSDVYSFGVVLVELISSKPAVDITRHRSEINLSNMAVDKIPRGLVHELVDPVMGFDEDPAVRRMVEQVAEVAFRCLQMERDMRPSMDEVRDTLRDIAGVGYTDLKGESVVSERLMKDDSCLLKSMYPPCSPNSVADKWIISRSTTPHTSA